MKNIILAIVLTHCVVLSSADMPRFFTNGHGGYQFFHAAENYQNSADRRMDSDASFSDAVKYVVKAPSTSPKPEPEVTPSSAPLESELPEPTRQEPVKVTSAPTQATKLLRHRLMPKLKLSNKILSDKSDSSSEDRSSENRILRDVTTTKPRARYTTPAHLPFRVTRKRIVVRKFKPQPKAPAEKNKKREISASTGNGLLAAHGKIPHKYKFTNRNFKPREAETPKNNAPSTHANRGALFSRKPSDKFRQLHFRKLDVTTTTTTISPMQGMKEKRHLANIRFFNRRKLRT